MLEWLSILIYRVAYETVEDHDHVVQSDFSRDTMMTIKMLKGFSAANVYIDCLGFIY